MKTTPFAVLAAAALSLSACATRIPYSKPLDAAASLPADGVIYIRLGRPLLEDAARAFLDPADLKAVRPLLAKTEKATAVVTLPVPGTAAGSLGMMYAIAEGAYPARSASFRLRLSRDWRREGRTLVRGTGELRLAFAGRNILAAGTGDLEPLLDRLSSPGPRPVPEDLEPLWEADGALWIARPAALAGGLLGVAAPALPARGLLLSLTAKEGGYAGTWVFDFENERSARIYAPLCRLVHLAFIRAVFGSDIKGANEALDRTAWTAAGGRVLASGFEIRGSDLLVSIAGAFTGR